MTIVIAASGTRGDVQPYVALGKGLKDAGYAVRVVSSDDFRSLIEEAGLEFGSMGSSVEQMLDSPEWREVVEGGNFLKILGRMTAEMKRRAQHLARLMPALYDGAEMIVAGLGGLGGAFSIAEKLGVPAIQAYVLPLNPTGAYASPIAPADSLGGTLNRLSFDVMRQALWQSTRSADVTLRRELGMRRASFWGPYRRLRKTRTPALYGYSRHVLPTAERSADLEATTGFWMLDPPATWTPPVELVEFLRTGPSPVYIGFGSMGSRNPEEAAQLILKALALSGQRGILATGWGGLHAADLPDSVCVIRAVPHRWLFPQMAAVVHHGGVGTTAAGLQAGLPSIVIPFMADQPFWGRRVAAMGVGPVPIPRKRLTAENLARAITQAVTDQPMRRRAADLGEKIRAEDGVGHAVALIRRWSTR
ncbi:MAG: glycosyltransferase family 1 protein [Anaerolineae bacterium]|nr:glycosyltransferase family 1 protein [Anaerolineae bacterium]